MGRDPATRQGSKLAASLILLVCSGAAADSLVAVPEAARRASWGGGKGDAARFGFLAEVRALGVLAADRLATWSDRRLGTEPGRPQLVAARPGLRIDLMSAPVLFVVRVDLGEPARPVLDDDPGAVGGALVDDLYVRWAPADGFRLTAGRAPVPWMMARQIEEIDQPLGAPAFVVDRLAPDRRDGVTVDGEAGAWRWVGGGYVDLDALEPRERADDPSRGGAAALALAARWTPPSYPQPSVGAGLLARLREDGSTRVDGTVGLSLAVRRTLLATAELIVSGEDGVELGGHAEVTLAPINRLAISLRGEVDSGAAGDGIWSAAGGVAWNVTRDRRNRIGVVGWLRRDRERQTPFDGLVVFLQAHL